MVEDLVAQVRRQGRNLDNVGDVFVCQSRRLDDLKIVLGDGVGDLVGDDAAEQRVVVGDAKDRFFRRHLALTGDRGHQDTVASRVELPEHTERRVLCRVDKHRVEDVDLHHRVDGKSLLRQERNGVGGASAGQIGVVGAVGVNRGVGATAAAFGGGGRMGECGGDNREAK